MLGPSLQIIIAEELVLDRDCDYFISDVAGLEITKGLLSKLGAKHISTHSIFAVNKRRLKVKQIQKRLLGVGSIDYLKVPVVRWRLFLAVPLFALYFLAGKRRRREDQSKSGSSRVQFLLMHAICLRSGEALLLSSHQG